MGITAALARTIARRPEAVAISTLCFALVVSILAFVPDYTIDAGLSSFEIQDQDVGHRQLAGDHFDEWALDSVSDVTCFDVGDCAWVRDDPVSACANEQWQRSECCRTCVDIQQAKNRGDPDHTEPRVPPTDAWQPRPPAVWVTPSTPDGYRRRLRGGHSSSNDGVRTLAVVAETQDGSSIFSPSNFAVLQDLQDKVLALPSFQSACDHSRGLDNGDGSGNDKNDEDAPSAPTPDNGCTGSSGVLFQHSLSPDAGATADFYAQQIWEGNFDLIMSGIVDKYFSSCNFTSTATTLSFHLKSGEKPYKSFMQEFIEMASKQPYRDSNKILLAWYEADNNDEIFLDTLMSDKNWACGAVIFVFALIWAQTRSLVITSAAFVHILLSLPVSQFFYGVVLGVDWISFLQVLPMFIIMGIGADDVFVFMDAWRRSIVDRPELAEAERQEERLTLVMEHSVNSMLITSVTTATSFAAICISSVAPLRTLGIFAALVVMLNFALCVTWFPAVVVICTQRGFYRNDEQVLAVTAQTGSSGRPVERWFQQYAQRLGDQGTRRLVLLGFGFVTGTALILTSQLAMPTAMPQLFPPDSNIAMFVDMAEQHFSFEKYPVTSGMVWGVHAKESTVSGQRGLGIAPINEDKMVPKLDQSVALDSEASQAAIVTTCRRLIGAKTLVRGGVNCPMLKFSEWLQEQGKDFPVSTVDFPLEYGNFLREGHQNYRSYTLFDEDRKSVV